MIVRKLRVKNWRRYRNEHAFDFEPGINLLVGENEAGKTTLFEALQRTLFDRHTGTSSDLEAMQPHESSLNPEASVVLERVEGERLRIVKRFLGKKMVEFSKHTGDEWRLEADGDAAEERMRELFDASLPGRGVTKPEHRGLAQALWYLQGEGLPEDSWNDSVQGRVRELDTEDSLPTSAPVEDAIVGAIQAERDRFWTPSGNKITIKSELGKLQENELPDLREESREIEADMSVVEENRRKLEELEDDARQKKKALEETEDRIETLEERLGGWEDELERRDELDDKIASTREELKDYDDDLSTLDALSDERDELEERLQEKEREKVERKAEKERLDDKIHRLDEQRKKKLRPDKEEAGQRATALEAEKRCRELREHLEKVEEKQETRKELEDELQEHRDDLSEVDAPSEEDLEEFREAKTSLERTRAEAEASAIEVLFDLEEQFSVTPQPEGATTDDTYRVVQPTTFSIDGVGDIHVEGGGRDLEELQGEIADLEQQIDETLSRYDADGEDELLERRKRADGIEEKIEEAKTRLDQIESADELAEEKQSLESRIKDEESKRAEFADEVEGLDGDELEEELSEARQRKQDLADELDELEDELAELREERADVAEEVQELESTLAELRAEKNTKVDRRNEILDNYGSLDRIEEHIRDCKQTIEELEDEQEELQRLVEQKVEPTQEELEQAEKQRESLEQALQEHESEANELKVEIRTLTGKGAKRKLEELKAELAQKEKRRDELKKRADAARLLWQLVERYRDERNRRLVGPIRSIVDDWLQQLTDQRHEHLELDETLTPDGVQMSNYDAPLPFSELSFGTREQTNVLLRLALAVLLSEDERHTVILDDRLLNSDPRRHRVLNQILEEVAEDCQILLATCNDTPYAGLDANKIRVPREGRTDAA